MTSHHAHDPAEASTVHSATDRRGTWSRRELIQHGAMGGLTAASLAAFLAACSSDGGTSTGSADATTSAPDGSTDSSTTAVPSGGTLKIGSITPSAASANLDPITVNDLGGLVLLSQVGQFLIRSNPDLTLTPQLATSWSANDDGSVWTFELEQKATFNDGTPVTAADVVATIERHLAPDSKANASSAFETGRLQAGGVKALDDHTVQFTLTGPMGNFPYIVSSDNYNLIILPASATDTSSFATSGIPTSGPFQIDSYDPTSGLTVVRNPNYWGTPPLVDKIEWVFIDDQAAQVTSFQTGDLDALASFSVQGGTSLLDDPDTTVIETPSANHRQIHLRTTKGPFADKRVRQAMSLALDRPKIIDALFSGKGRAADDTPLFDVYPGSGTQRPIDQNLEKAKALMAEAAPDGISATIYGYPAQEMPDLAAIIKDAVAEIGVNLTIDMRDDYYDVYWVPFDENTPGSDIGITDYGHRGVPDVYLTAPLKSPDAGGVWNAAEFSNKDYDAAVDEYTSAVDEAARAAAADKIRGILQEEVPVLFPFTFNWLVATKKNVTGLVPSPIGHLFSDTAAITA